jgi:hypothetical protein
MTPLILRLQKLREKPRKGKLYLLIAVINESRADLAQAVYSGILNSLTFQ